MSLKPFVLTLPVLVFAGIALADDVDRLPPWHAKAHALIQPTDAELQWKRIPWVTDLAEAVKLAKQEKRPLLVWTAGDDPLERC